MAGKPIPAPTDRKHEILCIEDLRKAALNKMPSGIAGTIPSVNSD
jgi:hypothetical protein